jgi:hypothetical protein
VESRFIDGLKFNGTFLDILGEQARGGSALPAATRYPLGLPPGDPPRHRRKTSNSAAGLPLSVSGLTVLNISRSASVTDHGWCAISDELPRHEGPSLPKGSMVWRRSWISVWAGSTGSLSRRCVRGSRSRHCARSSTDRASDYGSEGWGFESLRARSVLRQTTRP